MTPFDFLTQNKIILAEYQYNTNHFQKHRKISPFHFPLLKSRVVYPIKWTKPSNNSTT